MHFYRSIVTKNQSPPWPHKTLHRVPLPALLDYSIIDTFLFLEVPPVILKEEEEVLQLFHELPF